MKVLTGKKIKELRQKCGYTPTQLAHLMEITPEELKMYESGKLPVTDELLAGFADALRTRPDNLIGFNPRTKLIINTVEEEHKTTVYLITNGLICTGANLSEQGSVTLTFRNKE